MAEKNSNIVEILEEQEEIIRKQSERIQSLITKNAELEELVSALLCDA